MRILIVSQWFQPEPHFKGLDFAKALRARGHQVEVLTGFPNYPGGKVYPGYRVRPVQREVIDGISVTRGYLYPSHDRSALRRVANYLSFAASTTMLALFVRRPDVVYVYTPPMTATAAALLLRGLRGVPFVPDIQDLWPDTLAATGMLNQKHILKLVGWLTDFILRRAKRIIVLSEGFRQRLWQRQIEVPIDVVPNWAPPEITAVAASLPPLPRKDDFVVLFAGNLGKAQGLNTILEAAQVLAARAPHVRFVFIGGGVEAASLKEAASSTALQNVRFDPPRHPSEMGEAFANADALLVHLRDDPLFSITIPSKTQAYLAIGRPILMGVRGDAAKLVTEADAGICFEPDDSAALVRAVLRLLALAPGERDAMGAAGAAYYRARLAFDIGVSAIEQTLIEAASEKKSRAI